MTELPMFINLVIQSVGEPNINTITTINTYSYQFQPQSHLVTDPVKTISKHDLQDQVARVSRDHFWTPLGVVPM